MAKLRIDRQGNTIPSDYDDHYIELVRLLTEAAGLEHSLMVAYLFALFSIPQEFGDIRGEVTADSYRVHSSTGPNAGQNAATLLEVALEEMQHLSQVNWFLVELGSAPNFKPHTFPFVSDLYPFEIRMQSLTRYVAATYLYIEADSEKLKRKVDGGSGAESDDFINWVTTVLTTNGARPLAPNHIGSIYKRIIEQIYEVEKSPPDFLGLNFHWNRWKDEMSRICYQGEEGHYQFFRKVFTGEAFGSKQEPPGDPKVDLPTSRIQHRTAYSARAHSIPPGRQQRLAWLANLHYWIILCLLDVSYRSNTRHLSYKAMNNMTMALWRLGQHLADNTKEGEKPVGLPFDPMGPNYVLGRNDVLTIQILKRLVREAQGKAIELAKEGFLPPAYDIWVFDMTLAHIDALARPASQSDGVEFRFG